MHVIVVTRLPVGENENNTNLHYSSLGADHQLLEFYLLPLQTPPYHHRVVHLLAVVAQVACVETVLERPTLYTHRPRRTEESLLSTPSLKSR